VLGLKVGAYKQVTREFFFFCIWVTKEGTTYNAEKYQYSQLI